MSDSIDYRKLVEESQHGDDESLNCLSGHARERLYTYVFRLTMRDDLTQDVVQESMLEMFRFLDKLENPDRFWPWLRRIALNKVRHHYTREKARRMVSTTDAGIDVESGESDEGFSSLVTQELREIVSDTMTQLRERYREILVMRCYEEMGYSEIAEEMDCTEFSARVLFYRAKKSLAKQLSRRGLGKGALLTALVLFGKMTAPSEAAASQISVTAAATKVGTVAALAGMAGSKAVIVTLVAASVVTVGSVVLDPGEVTSPSGGGAGVFSQNVQQCWHFYPNGPGDAVMMRQMMPDRQSKQPYCLWLENDSGNFYYDRNSKTVHQNNHRMWSDDLAVKRLPTDDRELSSFLSDVEGKSVRMEHVSEGGRGLLAITTPEGESKSILHPNLLDEEYYRYNWPRDVQIRDNRDELHKRGWSYFVISGEIDGEKVKGFGRVPFVYSKAVDYSPWFRMQVGGRLVICDRPGEMYICDVGRSVWRKCPEGSFFAGLGRPWMGLHTIDTVRRDAAAQRIRFESEYVRGSGKKEAQVRLICEDGEIVYSIDMYKDVVESIAINLDGAEGVIEFEYVADLEGLTGDIVVPRRDRSVTAHEYEGIGWLLHFAEKSLVR
jgi:RNA polymerase sigma-70 factor (ECF subfamily)